MAASLGSVDGVDVSAATAALMKDPRVLALLQEQLTSIEGESSGMMEDMPPAIIKRVNALKQLQKQHLAIERDFHNEVAQLEAKYASKFDPLYARRTAIIKGEHEPTEEEGAVYDGEEEEEEKKKEADGDVGIEEITDEKGPAASAEKNEGADGAEEAEGGQEEAAAAAASADVPKGIPNFWLACLQNNPMVADLIEDHDVEVLRYLEDITVTLHDEPNSGFDLHFHFSADNEFFHNEKITKSYELDPSPEATEADAEEEGLEDLIYEGPVYKKASGTVIAWKEGKDVTVKRVKKKQKKRGGSNAGKTRTIVKTVEQNSFFRFFSPRDPEEVPEEEQGMVAELLNFDYEVGEVIKEKIVPHSVLWFTGEALEYEEGGEEEEEEEEEEDEMAGLAGMLGRDYGDGYQSGSDPDFVPGPDDGSADKPPECKQS